MAWVGGALAAGCSLILKASEETPGACVEIVRCFADAGLPPGVINFVPGDPAVVAKLALESQDLAGVHFTGSTKVFNEIWRSVAGNLEKYRGYPRLVGETGG